MQKDREDSLRLILIGAGYKEGDSLVVAVSGGPDSLALLHQLLSLLGSEALHVAHLDHGIRPNSAADARFVAKLSQEWGLPFHCKRIEVPALAKRQKWSLEEAARNARYKFLAKVANGVGAKIVTVGHHEDDQAETVLLHLLRGSGLTGLRGMPAVGVFPGKSNLKLVRPLIHQTRSEIEAYCERHELQPLADESNNDPAYLRNRIRHHLMPDLATYNPRIGAQLVQLANIVGAEDDLLGSLLNQVWPDLGVEDGRDWLSMNRRRFQELPLALQRRTVRRVAATLIPDVSDLSFKSVEQAVEIANRKESGTETMLPGGLTMLADYDTVLFSLAGAERPSHLPQLSASEPVLLPVPGKIELANNWVMTAQPVGRNPGDLNLENDPWLVFADLPKHEPLYVRSRRSGERMRPMGMEGHSASLQDIMVNRKISSHLRDRWPLVTTDKHVVWLAGHVIDQRVSVSEGSRSVVRLKIERIGSEH